jgi:hypothetical protein
MKAFPMTHPSENTRFIDAGMDLRDYFAVRAMQSIIIYEEGEFNLVLIAEESYRMADCMMEARKKE